MSEFTGHVLCPACEGGSFYIEHWGTYISVTCRKCGFKMRELDISWFEEYPRWKREDR